MALRSISAREAADDLGAFDAILDARSPAEFAEDHLPGALNWPTLDDAQRHEVGLLYVQTGPLPARKLGAAMAARNIADHLDRWIGDKPREWKPLVYCWRGGQRSGSLALILDQIGFRVTRLDGGYKGFRSAVRDDLATLPDGLDLRVLAGRTGSGKTRLLQALAAEGAQVLDLEGLACHRGSILGGQPDQPQPSQKSFDTRLWQAMKALDPSRPVYVESESKKIGRLHLPDALFQRLHSHGRVLHIEMPMSGRLALLMEEYAFFLNDADAFCRLLDGLRPLRGHEIVNRWQALARAGEWMAVNEALMREHYDPLYLRSIERHYGRLDQAEQVPMDDGGAPALARAARHILDAEAAPRG